MTTKAYVAACAIKEIEKRLPTLSCVGSSAVAYESDVIEIMKLMNDREKELLVMNDMNGEDVVLCESTNTIQPFFRFPHLKKFDHLNVYDYDRKIAEEAREVGMADGEARVIEIMDVMQACETALRNSGYSEEELWKLKETHDKKDTERGYTEE